MITFCTLVGNRDHNGGLGQINGIPQPTDWERAAD
jgi:hypothetical protein